MNDENNPLWTIMEYELFSGEGAVTKWLRKCKKVDEDAELGLDTILANLLSLKMEMWDLPDYRAKMVNMEGIGEIRFDNRQHLQLRVFGFFLVESSQYVLLAGAVKQGNNNYDPSDIRNTAVRRKDEVEKGLNEIIEFEGIENED